LPDTAVITIVVVGGGGGAAAAMSSPSGIVKRIPLIKFPNRKAGQTQGIVLRLLVLCFFPPPLHLCFGIGSIWFRSFCGLEMAPLSLSHPFLHRRCLTERLSGFSFSRNLLRFFLHGRG
jgi:hypothetical protein